MSDYLNLTRRFVDLGLNLRDDTDKVTEGFSTILKNLSPQKEGSNSTRPGRALNFNTGTGLPIHTIDRVDTTTTLVGSGTQLFRNSTPYSTGGYSGNPLSVVQAKPAIGSTFWSYIGDSLRMRKVNVSGSDQKWGIAEPTVAATFQALGAGDLDSSVAGAVVYDWRYAYYSSVTGSESNPSPVGNGISVIQQRAQVTVTASTDPQVDCIRVYRRGGTQVTTWRLDVTVGNISGNHITNNADSTIALNKVIGLDNYVPFSSVDNDGNSLNGVPMPYIWGPFIGKYLFGAGDPNRPGYVYWTNSERPDTADVSNNIQVSAPNKGILNGFIYSSNPFVWTRENLFALDFGGPLSTPKFAPRRTPCGRGLAAPYAFAVGPTVVFLSRDGIYETDTQSEARILTESSLRPIFQGYPAGGISPIDFAFPSDIRLFYTDLEYHFLYKAISGIRVHLVYNTIYKRWRQEVTQGFTETVVVLDKTAATQSIYVGSGEGKVYTVAGTTDDGVPIQWQGRTGSEDLDRSQTLKEFGNLVLDVDSQSTNITVTPYLNAEATALSPLTVNTTTRGKSPLSLSDTYGYSIAFDFVGTGPASLYTYDILFRFDEEQLLHWELPATSHGYPGWQHVRDIYFGLKSNGDITFTLTVDGVAHSYVVPSTGGRREKAHIYVDPVRGKMFQYKLDSTGLFSIYGEDCEVRVKPWTTSLGYQLISPFRKADVREA
jgi:hypothetical protein